MHHIIYSSRVTQIPTDSELVVLLLQSRQRNERVGITGALVYGGGHYMQVIEGQQEAVTALYERISSDPRHQAICKLVDESIEQRTFANWAMAFQRASAEQVTDLEGYVSPEHWEQTYCTNELASDLLMQQLRAVVLRGYNSRPPA